MCGICGKLIFNGGEVIQSDIELMLRFIGHRGPDDKKTYVNSNVGLGQARLSIIDLDKRACAPLSNEDGSIWIVFNGEIYNHENLRAQLMDLGHQFKTRSDTEVLVHAYEEYGVDMLNKLNGMFAFAIWDQNKRRLFAARDRLGEKPFFYCMASDVFVFGSEMKALMADGSIANEPNMEAVEIYLRRQFVPAPLTAFQNVYKLQAGHYLIIDNKKDIVVRPYWAPKFNEEKHDWDLRETEQILKKKIVEAVDSRLMADVEIGAFLSGGIDSAAIVSIAAMECGRKLRTFSLGFLGDGDSELPYAKEVANKLGLVHEEVRVRPALDEMLPALAYYYNEPFGDASAVPTFYLSQATSKEVKVALTGDGGDELFAGYNHYYRTLEWEALEMIPETLRLHVARYLRSSQKRLAKHYPYSFKLSRICEAMEVSRAGRYVDDTALFKNAELDLLISISEGDGYESLRRGWLSNSKDVNKNNFLDWMMAFDQGSYLPDCLMVKTDVASMANGLELRSPFLDHRLVEFASKLPLKMKYDGTNSKAIVRRILNRVLPLNVLNKKKTGFRFPLIKCISGNNEKYVRHILQGDRMKSRGLYNDLFVEKMITETVNGSRDWGNRIWALLMLEMWFQKYVD